MGIATDDLLLPNDAMLMHIGPQKTGSTALQAATRAQRSALRRHGVAAFGLSRAERLALWSALMHPDSSDPRHREGLALWATVVDQAAREPGRTFLSHESLGKADKDGARRMVATLGGSRVHVLAVARRLDRLLPSQWQQRVKSGATTLSYEDWLEVVLGDQSDDPVWKNIWVPHHLEGLVDRWTGAAAPDRFTLVVADESDRRLLSRVVEQMLDLPEGLLQPEESHRANASLSYDRLELLRVLSRLVDETWPGGDPTGTSAWTKACRRAVRQAETVAGERRVPALPPWALERVTNMSRQRADLVRSLDVRVVGDPDNLLVPEETDPQPPTRADMVPTELAARVLELAIRFGVEQQAESPEHSSP